MRSAGLKPFQVRACFKNRKTRSRRRKEAESWAIFFSKSASLRRRLPILKHPPRPQISLLPQPAVQPWLGREAFVLSHQRRQVVAGPVVGQEALLFQHFRMGGEARVAEQAD